MSFMVIHTAVSKLNDIESAIADRECPYPCKSAFIRLPCLPNGIIFIFYSIGVKSVIFLFNRGVPNVHILILTTAVAHYMQCTYKRTCLENKNEKYYHGN